MPPAPSGDYDALLVALMASARGRRFLEEHARRSRVDGAQPVLEASTRLAAARRKEQARREHRTGAAAAIPSSEAGIRAAAERILDATWTMRERGFATSTCNQIHALAASILSAASLQDQRRAPALGEVLNHLERRIDAMLASAATAVGSEPPLPSTPDGPTARAKPTDQSRPEDGVAPGAEQHARAASSEPLLSAARPQQAASPLAALEALSEAERIALFS